MYLSYFSENPLLLELSFSRNVLNTKSFNSAETCLWVLYRSISSSPFSFGNILLKARSLKLAKSFGVPWPSWRDLSLRHQASRLSWPIELDHFRLLVNFAQRFLIGVNSVLIKFINHSSLYGGQGQSEAHSKMTAYISIRIAPTNNK